MSSGLAPRFCHLCGHSLASDARFCSACGAAVVAPGEAPPATAQTPTQSPPPAQQPVTSVPSRRVTAIAWWKRRGRTAQVGLVLGAIVLLLIPLSALGSSGDSKHVAIKPIQSPPSATTNVP